MHVLLVEDDRLRPSRRVQIASMVVDTADFVGDGYFIAQHHDYDIIVLDLVLPMDGAEVLRRLRQAGVITPVLILSGLAQVETKVRCFAAGADDYLTKPFDKRELVARIEAIVRRSQGHGSSEIRTGHLVLDLARRTVSVDDCLVHLTCKEYGVLELLSLRKGATLTKEMFFDHLYGGLDEPEIKIIDVFICKLRKKLTVLMPGGHGIETVWGRGYMLRDPNKQVLP